MSQKNDMEKFVELYKSFGIDLEIEQPLNDGYYDVSLSGEVSNKFRGYAGFGSVVIFDKDGKFVSQEFYE